MTVPDVTTLVRLEGELLRAREQLIKHEALSTTGALAAGVGHDLVNVLTALKLGIASIAEASAGGDASLGLDAIARAAALGAALASKLVSVGRPPYGLPILLDLPQALDGAVELVQAGSRGRTSGRIVPLRIVAHVPPLPKVRGYPVDVQRVFINVLLNACDAMPEGGTITVSATVSQRAVVVSVEDEGPGIRQEHLPHIFDMFFTTKGSAGSGIGLAVAKTVMESLGGSISCGNRRDGGARFDLRFPAAIDREE